MSRRTARSPAPSAPPAITTLALIGLVAFIVVPLLGLLQRVPWSDLAGLLADPGVRTALRVSLVSSVSATAVSLLFGLPLAWMLARAPLPGRSIVRALVLMPMVLPPVVGGTALLLALGPDGLLGQWLDRGFGLVLPETMPGAVVAQTFVAMPFLVITVEGALRALDDRYEDAAATLGASRWTVLRRVTLPLIGPALAAGTALTWARALGEFGATITFAGNVEGRTRTMPLAVFLELDRNRPAAIALSVVLLALSVGVLAVAGKRAFASRHVAPAA